MMIGSADTATTVVTRLVQLPTLVPRRDDRILLSDLPSQVATGLRFAVSPCLHDNNPFTFAP
jgi:hypothetical protein